MRKILGLVIAPLVGISSLLVASPSFAQGWPRLPNHGLTPGLTRGLTVKKICNTKWGSDARSVTSKMKKDVMAAYHFKVTACPLTVLKGKKVHRVEIDHLVPRSIGGADDVKNLWPECYEPVKKNKSKQADGAHKKDRLETELHRRVCKAKSAALLKQYQNKIKTNWISLYHKIYGNE
jgi:5-methylcytosine-specific restriction endonuclease McrA